jgi:hypothetical protein
MREDQQNQDVSQQDPYQSLVRQNLLDQGGPATSTDPTSTLGVAPPPGGAPQPGPGPGPGGSPFLNTGPAPPPYTPGQPGSYQPGSPNDPNKAPPTPPPSPQTQPSAAPVAPPSYGGPTAPAAPPNASSSIPPDLLGILNSLKEGITNFQIPPINLQPQTTPAYDDLVRSAIMDAIKQGSQPVDAQDPLVAPILSAVQGQAQRAKDANANTLAEQLSAQHLASSGAYSTGTERYNQGIDEATGGTIAQLMTNVLTQRQQRLQQAISTGANFLTTDQAQQLQKELGNVNSALAQYQAKSSVGLGTLASLLQNQQFFDALGNNIGQFASNANQNAVP